MSSGVALRDDRGVPAAIIEPRLCQLAARYVRAGVDMVAAELRRNGRELPRDVEAFVELIAHVAEQSRRQDMRQDQQDRPDQAHRANASHPPRGGRILTAVEAAGLVGVDPSYVTRLCRTGKVPGARKVGTAWHIPHEAAAALAARRTPAA